MNLPPPPVFDALTTVNKNFLDSRGEWPVKFTSIMWLQWLQQLWNYVISGASSSDSTILNIMEGTHEGAVNIVDKKGNDTLTLVEMITMGQQDKDHSQTDVGVLMVSIDMNEVMKMKNDLETMIYMGGN